MLLTGIISNSPTVYTGNFWDTLKQIADGVLHNKVFLFTIIAWASAQLIKTVLTLFTEKKFKVERLFGDGGMPSGHSATVTTMSLLIGYVYGFDSGLFALAAIFAVVTMHDAMGVRREAGKHAVSIKELAAAVNEMAKDQDMEVKIEKLKILVGHTPLQVCAGALLGLLIAIIGMICIHMTK